MTLTVGVILIGSLLVPVLSDTSATTDTYTNEGYFRMSETSEETVIVWNPSDDPSVVTVNGTEMSLESIIGVFNTSYSIAFADDFILRFFNSSTTAQSIQLWNSVYVDGIASSSAYVLTVTIDADGISWVTTDSTDTEVANNTYTHSGSYFALDADGDYILKYKGGSAYVNPTSTIVYAGGISLLAGTTFSGVYFEGTIDDLTVTVSNSKATVSDAVASYTEDDSHLDLALLDKVTFTTTYSETETAQTYNYFLVPYEVTAERAQHMTSAEIAILAIIPVLVIVSLVVLAVNRVRYD